MGVSLRQTPAPSKTTAVFDAECQYIVTCTQNLRLVAVADSEAGGGRRRPPPPHAHLHHKRNAHTTTAPTIVKSEV